MKQRSTRSPQRSTAQPLKRVLITISAEHVVGRRILEGVADYAEHHRGWQHFLELNSRLPPALAGGMDGIIVSHEIHSAWGPDARTTIPTVRVTGPPEADGPPAVIADNPAVGAMGANYLADLGLKHLVFVPEGAFYSQYRAMGFIETCRSRGIKYEVLDTQRAMDLKLLQADLARLPDPVGILVATDRRALEVSRACMVLGKRIPEQVALLGVDNEAEICRLVDPPLTSIDQGPRRIGYEAARLLDEWMSTGVRPTESVCVQPTGVVTRQSTDLLAIDEPDVVAAIRFIRSHFGDAIKVKDVLNHVAMSRRSLEMHFRAALGRTVHEEIMRVRIERAKQLLATSEWTMPYIADQCGFALASQFSFVFKRETGETPQEFRSRHRYSGR